MDRGSVVLKREPEKLERGVQQPDLGREQAELELPGLRLPLGLMLGLGLKLELGLGQELELQDQPCLERQPSPPPRRPQRASGELRTELSAPGYQACRYAAPSARCPRAVD